jgi:hypothetical protein
MLTAIGSTVAYLILAYVHKVWVNHHKLPSSLVSGNKFKLILLKTHLDTVHIEIHFLGGIFDSYVA